jgi:hypothetical protein
VYESPASLAGRERWLTSTEDVDRVEALLGMDRGTIGAPLRFSGDERACPGCAREINWLDIVSSALRRVHDARMIARVFLGEQKYVNIEAPDAIRGVQCADCGAAIETLRRFTCHNSASAVEDMANVLRHPALVEVAEIDNTGEAGAWARSPHALSWSTR